VAIHAYSDPLGKASALVARLRAEAANHDMSTESARLLGSAAVAIGAFDVASSFLATAVEGLRTGGRLGHLPRVLALQVGGAAALDWSPHRGYLLAAGDRLIVLATRTGLDHPDWAGR